MTGCLQSTPTPHHLPHFTSPLYCSRLLPTAALVSPPLPSLSHLCHSLDHIPSALPASPTAALPLGFTLAEATFTTSGVNRYFRYASAGARLPTPPTAPAEAGADEEQQWVVATNMTWVRPDLLPSWPVRNQAGCGDCWAQAVVASIEAAYAILAANGSLPVFSVASLVADMKADCSGGSPSKAFQYLLAVGKCGGGLQAERVRAGGVVARAGGTGAMGVGVAEGSSTVGFQRKQRSAAAAAGGNALCSPLLKPIAALLGLKCTAKEKAEAGTVSGVE